MHTDLVLGDRPRNDKAWYWRSAEGPPAKRRKPLGPTLGRDKRDKDTESIAARYC